LRQAITLLRGYGLQVWSFWQDLSQLRHLYPQDWQTMINNSGVLQVFGLNNHLLAKEWGEVMGVDPAELAELGPEQAGLYLHGSGFRKCRRADYLRDRVFAGKFDANPRFALVGAAEPALPRSPAHRAVGTPRPSARRQAL